MMKACSKLVTLLELPLQFGGKMKSGVQPVSLCAGEESTIYALATGGIRCGLAIIRVSGTQTRHIMQTIGRFYEPPEPRKAILRKFYDPRSTSNIMLDVGMLLWFPEPKSYTGEDSCEFIVHGGTAIVTSFLRSIGSFSGCRMAKPGEFSKRAFLNGKIKTLTEVDGLHDLIMAETELQRMQALNQMTGKLGDLYASWKNKISKCLASAEAYIDFGEDENIEHGILEVISNDVIEVINEVKSHLLDKRKGERLRSGVRICIFGNPNTGKSSLLNLLCRREAAIVSDVPGTTRDVIEATVNLQGYPVIFADTAGLRTSPDLIESEGIRRAVSQALESDIIILLTDWTSFLNSGCSSRRSFIHDQLNHLVSNSDETSNILQEDLIQKLFLVLNKVDLRRRNDDSESPVLTNIFDAEVSCKTNEKLDELLAKLTNLVAALCADPKSEAPYLTQERYRANLEKCWSNLQAYIDTPTKDLALKTNYLKNAMNNIGCITGHVGTEDILDIIFRDFCIGK